MSKCHLGHIVNQIIYNIKNVLTRHILEMQGMHAVWIKKGTFE